MIYGADGNYILHRAFHTQNYESKDPGAAIAKKFVSMVCKEALFVKAKKILVAFDGNRIFRYDLYRDYKGTRHKDGPSPYDYLGGLLEYLAFCGIATVQLSRYEADDVLCSLAAKNDKVAIGTRDKDAYQYLRPGVLLIDGTAKPEPKIITYDKVEKLFGVKPGLCLDLQTLTGDSIDNVPSLLPRAKAIKGLKLHGSLKNWLAADSELRALLRNKKEELKLNRKLVKLVSTIDVSAETPKWNSSQSMPASYVMLKDFANIRAKSLF